MDMTALIGAVGIAIPSLAAALALWRKLRNAKVALNDNVQAGLAVVADLEQTKEKLKQVGETYDKISEKLRNSENLLTTLEDAASAQVNANGVGIDFLVKKLEVPYSVAYRMAKKPESPFHLENIPSVGKRWRAKAGSVQDWLGR
jgi:hypothetical protein